MDTEFLQALRYKLQRRVRRLNSTDYKLFHSSLKQFWGFLQKSNVIFGIIDDLKKRHPNAAEEIAPMFSKGSREGGLLWNVEDEHAAASIFIVERCVQSDDQMIEVNIGRKYSNDSNYNEILESF